MAPEILLEQGYGPEIDWWSVGVILYECLIGYAPFSCEDTTETCIMILEFQSTLDFPDDPRITDEARDLIQNCLLVEQKSRTGYEGIVSHPWFRSTDFNAVRYSKAPWVPDLTDEIDTHNFDDFEDDNVDYFFGEDYKDDFEEQALKDLDDKHLPFVGWTFKRFEPKEKPSATSVFQNDGSNTDPPASPTDDKREKSKNGKSKMAVWSSKRGSGNPKKDKDKK